MNDSDFNVEGLDDIDDSMKDSFDKDNNQNKNIEDNINMNYDSMDFMDSNIIKKKDIENNDNDINFDTNIIKSNENIINFDNTKEIPEAPIKLIEFQKSDFILNPEALNILNSIQDDLIIVSIVGKARTGKSYLMNLLLNNSQSNKPGDGFTISSKLESCTRGIWLWNTPRLKPNSSAKIIFIDSEGTNSVDLSTKTYDSKIFALIVLISSLFIYNTNGNIDEKSIGDLALAAHLSNVVATNSIEDKDLIINELAPKFIWVLRDFILDKIDPETGEEISSDEYLELCLRNKTISGNKNKNSIENNLIRENIIKYFKERECITLPRPVDNEEDLHKLNEIPFSKLKTNFREEFFNLKKTVYETSKVKRIGNKKINGPILVGLLTSFINALNSKIIPNINTAFDNIIIHEIEKKYENCLNIWKDNYTKIKDNQNFSVKDLYDGKYFIMNEYSSVKSENREIKFNKQYKDIYDKYELKLSSEIQCDMDKIKIINSNKKKAILNNILNKFKNNNIYLNANQNNLEKNQIDLVLNLINQNYTSFLNEIKDYATILNEDKNIKLFGDKGKDKLINYIEEIKMVLNKYHDKQLEKINLDIKENELYLNEHDLNNLEQINETLIQRYQILNEELNAKDKEIFGLIGQYTKLEEKKNKIIESNYKIKRIGQNISTMKSQNLLKNSCGIMIESSEKGCGCELGEICNIF